MTALFMVAGLDNPFAADKILARTTELFKSIWENRCHIRSWAKKDHMYEGEGKYMEPVTCLVVHYNAFYHAR